MSGQSAKRGKTTAMASPSVPTIDCLPPDLLETVLGYLDVRTLCTARLVCAQFRGAASRCIHCVEISAETLRGQPETTLNSFPNLSRVSVFDVRRDNLEMLAQSPVAAAVTHLRTHAHFREEPAQIAAGTPLVPLPNLTSLTVNFGPCAAFFFLQTLRELIFEHAVDPRTANLVTGLTNLTSLRIDVHETQEPFQAVTALTALQRLEICGEWAQVPLVAELTLLTHLQFVKNRWTAALPDLAPLTRLHRLVHVGVLHLVSIDASMERHVLAGVARLTSLRSLDLKLCRWPDRSAFETVCMAPFSQLTALRLESEGLHASFLPRFNLEMLQDLRLSLGMQLDRDGVAALGRATGLTELELWGETVEGSVEPEEWELALSRMSRLRALSLDAHNAAEAKGPLQAVALLTELTRLDLNGRGVATNAAGEVCLGLKKLRVLSISLPFSPPSSDPITPETFFAIAKLPELCKFEIVGHVPVSDWALTDDVRARLNVERHHKGWPPLELSV